MPRTPPCGGSARRIIFLSFKQSRFVGWFAPADADITHSVGVFRRLGRFGRRGNRHKQGGDMRRVIRSNTELQAICLRSLKACPGFERVSEILIQPRTAHAGGANWTLAAVRPRVDNEALRGARSIIDRLQRSYQLSAIDPPADGIAINRRGDQSPSALQQ
jgi:hypothetical protein